MLPVSGAMPLIWATHKAKALDMSDPVPQHGGPGLPDVSRVQAPGVWPQWAGPSTACIYIYPVAGLLEGYSPPRPAFIHVHRLYRQV